MKYWISAPSRFGAMTVRVECSPEGIVRETYTAWPWARGLHVDELIAKLRSEHGEQVEVARL
jgi:hypothetical protein